MDSVNRFCSEDTHVLCAMKMAPSRAGQGRSVRRAVLRMLQKSARRATALPDVHILPAPPAQETWMLAYATQTLA